VSQPPSELAANGIRTYKPGDTVTYVASFSQDVADDLGMTAFFSREGGPDQSGLQWEVLISSVRRVDARHAEVSGTVPHVASGKYNLVRLDVSTGGATKMNNNPDPDHDSGFMVKAEAPKIPDVTDFDPK
jgi:hypothetical protein